MLKPLTITTTITTLLDHDLFLGGQQRVREEGIEASSANGLSTLVAQKYTHSSNIRPGNVAALCSSERGGRAGGRRSAEPGGLFCSTATAAFFCCGAKPQAHRLIRVVVVVVAAAAAGERGIMSSNTTYIFRDT